MPATPPQKRRGRPALVPEETILATAFHEFSIRSFESVSMRDIERTLGMSRNSLYQRYGSKDQLWRDSVDFYFKKLKRSLAPYINDVRASQEPLKALRTVVMAYLRASCQWPALGRMMTLEGVSGGDRLHYIFEQHSKDTMAPFLEVISWLADEGYVRRISTRTLYFFVARGASSPFTLAGLSECFDAIDGPFLEEEYIQEASTMIVNALTLPQP